jgi:hypothetical protein
VEREKRYIRHLILIIILVALIFFLGYIIFSDGEAVFDTKEVMYFTSDFLTDNGDYYPLSEGTTSISIKLRNHDGEYKSEVDIDYMIEVVGGAVKTGSLMLNEVEDEIIFENLTSGTYEIKAETTYPYKKILKGTFFIP